MRKRAISLAQRTSERLPQVLDDLQDIRSERFAADFAETVARRARWIEQRLVASD